MDRVQPDSGVTVGSFCAACGAGIPAQALSCPACHELTHATQLQELAQRARGMEVSGDKGAAAQLWRQALNLLPPESTQAASIRDRIASLDAALRVPEQKPQPEWIKRLGPFGVVIAAILKFKTAAFLVLTKAKFLILGLTKLQTLLSMLATMGLYWSLYGWRFGVGFVLGIYIHEMGHVWMLRHYGLRASAPMFIPGFGAFVSLYDSPPDVTVDARIGLAGPLWGAGAALMSLAMGLVFPGGVWAAIAHATAYINLFNLIPVWQLDGGRGFRALDYKQRLYWFGLAALLWYFSGSGLFLLLLAGAAYRIFWKKDHAPVGDQTAMMQFAGLMILFAAMLALLR